MPYVRITVSCSPRGVAFLPVQWNLMNGDFDNRETSEVLCLCQSCATIAKTRGKRIPIASPNLRLLCSAQAAQPATTNQAITACFDRFVRFHSICSVTAPCQVEDTSAGNCWGQLCHASGTGLPAWVRCWPVQPRPRLRASRSGSAAWAKLAFARMCVACVGRHRARGGDSCKGCGVSRMPNKIKLGKN